MRTFNTRLCSRERANFVISKTKSTREGCFLFWPTRKDSNLRPSESESDALSSCATGRNIKFLGTLPDKNLQSLPLGVRCLQTAPLLYGSCSLLLAWQDTAVGGMRSLTRYPADPVHSYVAYLRLGTLGSFCSYSVDFASDKRQSAVSPSSPRVEILSFLGTLPDKNLQSLLLGVRRLQTAPLLCGSCSLLLAWQDTS